MRRAIIGFIITCALGCLCVAPLAPEAQPPTHVHRIGVLSGRTPGRDSFVEAFLEGMRALGYVEGQHFVLEYRGAEGQFEGFPDLAAELVRLKVEVIVAQGTPAALAAKHATTTIPIVMVGVGGIHLNRDSRWWIAYSEELISSTISATLQSADRHDGIVGQERCHLQFDS